MSARPWAGSEASLRAIWDEVSMGQAAYNQQQNFPQTRRGWDQVEQRPKVEGPTADEAAKYPALNEAWKTLTEEYEVIRKLTTGEKK